MYEEREMLVGDMQLQKALYKSLYLFYEAQKKYKRLTYATVNRFMYFLQELWIFACIIT